MTVVHEIEPDTGRRAGVRRSFVEDLRSHWRRVGVALLATLLQALTILPIPILVREAVDVAIPGHRVGRLYLVAGGIVALTALSGLFGVVGQHFFQRSVKEATASLRERIAARVFRMDYAALGDLDPAEAHERLITDPGWVEQEFNIAFRSVLPNVAITVGLVVVLLRVDVRLAVVTALVGPLIYASVRLSRPRISRFTAENQRIFEGLTRSSMLVIRLQSLIRARGTAPAEEQLLRDGIHDLKRISASRSIYTIGVTSVQSSTVALASAITLGVGGQSVISGRITLGSLLSFFASVALLRGPVSALANASPAFIEGRLAEARIDAFFAGPMRTGLIDLPATPPPDFRTVSLHTVSYRYPGGAAILDRFSLVLAPGRRIALAGPNGAGKTTVLALLLGLLEPDSGTIRVDGVPLAELHVDVHAFRRGIGVAFQHSEFVPGTIRENVRYGRPDASEDDVLTALRDAEADIVVAKLDKGLDAWIGEDGDRLSGGERQRIAIARAILGHPRLVVLDEPSNHLPQAVILRILDRMAQWDNPPAVLLISHDPKVLAAADETVLITPAESVDGQMPAGLRMTAVAR